MIKGAKTRDNEQAITPTKILIILANSMISTISGPLEVSSKDPLEEGNSQWVAFHLKERNRFSILFSKIRNYSIFF